MVFGQMFNYILQLQRYEGEIKNEDPKWMYGSTWLREIIQV